VRGSEVSISVVKCSWVKCSELKHFIIQQMRKYTYIINYLIIILYIVINTHI